MSFDPSVIRGFDPNDTTPTSELVRVHVAGVPDESEDVLYSDITTKALDRAQIAAARVRDELAAVAQGDQAVIERALYRAQMEAFIRESAVAIATSVAKLQPRETLSDDTLHAARTLVAFLDRMR